MRAESNIENNEAKETDTLLQGERKSNGEFKGI